MQVCLTPKLILFLSIPLPLAFNQLMQPAASQKEVKDTDSWGPGETPPRKMGTSGAKLPFDGPCNWQPPTVNHRAVSHVERGSLCPYSPTHKQQLYHPGDHRTKGGRQIWTEQGINKMLYGQREKKNDLKTEHTRIFDMQAFKLCLPSLCVEHTQMSLYFQLRHMPCFATKNNICASCAALWCFIHRITWHRSCTLDAN